MEIIRSHSAYISPRDELTLIQRLSRSENVLYGTNLESMSAEIISKSCDNLSMETSNENGEKSNLPRYSFKICVSSCGLFALFLEKLLLQSFNISIVGLYSMIELYSMYSFVCTVFIQYCMTD